MRPILRALLFLAGVCCVKGTSDTDSVIGNSAVNSTPNSNTTVDPALLHAVYASTFRLRDGSVLASADAEALHAMRESVGRLLAVGDRGDWLGLARALPDDRLLGVLMLAVAGNFTVYQPAAMPQRCGIVVDPSSGALVLQDSAATQSVILETLLIVSIVCLVKAWGK